MVRRHFWQSPYINWLTEIPDDCIVLVMYLRSARSKAKVVAIVEALCLLNDLNAQALIGGPLAEKAGVFWIALPKIYIESALVRLPHLGFVKAVDLLQLVESRKQVDVEDTHSLDKKVIHWKKRKYYLVRVYEENPKILRQLAPDKRTFLLRTEDGKVRPIRGYRGSSAPLGRRGLPVCDARMLVNLVSRRAGELFLDPFAGIGGIILEAVSRGHTAISSDIDPVLRYGLSQFSALHCIADARALPFSSATFDAIAAEPPFHDNSGVIMVQALIEIYRVLKDRGRLALMCAEWQSKTLLRQAKELDLTPYLDSPINRKGLDVVVLAWRKDVEERLIEK